MIKTRQNNFTFIDSQNLNLAILDQGWKLDFAKFYIYLKHKFHITKAFIIIGYIPEMKNFIVILEKLAMKLFINQLYH